MSTALARSSYVDGDGQLVIDDEVVCAFCLEVPQYCEAVQARSAHVELAELAAEAAAAPLLWWHLGGAA